MCEWVGECTCLWIEGILYAYNHGTLRVSCCFNIMATALLLPTRDLLPNHQEPLSVLRDSQFFSRYVMGVALQKVRQVRGERGRASLSQTLPICCGLCNSDCVHVCSCGTQKVTRSHWPPMDLTSS